MILFISHGSVARFHYFLSGISFNCCFLKFYTFLSGLYYVFVQSDTISSFDCSVEKYFLSQWSGSFGPL